MLRLLFNKIGFPRAVCFSIRHVKTEKLIMLIVERAQRIRRKNMLDKNRERAPIKNVVKYVCRKGAPSFFKSTIGMNDEGIGIIKRCVRALWSGKTMSYAYKFLKIYAHAYMDLKEKMLVKYYTLDNPVLTYGKLFPASFVTDKNENIGPRNSNTHFNCYYGTLT